MKANLLLVTYGSLTDFSQRTARICDIAWQIGMPTDSVVTLLARFDRLDHDVERLLQY